MIRSAILPSCAMKPDSGGSQPLTRTDGSFAIVHVQSLSSAPPLGTWVSITSGEKPAIVLGKEVRDRPEFDEKIKEDFCVKFPSMLCEKTLKDPQRSATNLGTTHQERMNSV